MADIPFVKLVGRLTLTIGDTDDPDIDPDVIPCDEGIVRFIPVNTFVKVVDGTPVPFTAGNTAIDVPLDTDGYLSWQDARWVPMLDFTSPSVNPTIAAGSATHEVQFRNVKAQGTSVPFPTTKVRLAADSLTAVNAAQAAAYGLTEGDLVCDLAKLTPVPTAGSTPIVRGEQGVGIESLDVAGDALTYTLTDGSTGQTTALPTALVDSAEFIASQIPAPGPVNDALNGAIGTTVGVAVDSVNTDRKMLLPFTSRYPGSAGAPKTTAGFIAKPHGDGTPGIIDWIHHDTTGYLFHLQTGSVGTSPNSPADDAPGSNPAFLIALGLDVDNGAGGLGVGGLLVANKVGSYGIQLHQQATITHANGYGFYGIQESSLAPMFRLEQDVANGAPMMQWFSNVAAGDTGRLLDVIAGGSAAGRIMAVDGHIEWQRPIQVSDKDGSTPSFFEVATTGSTPANQRAYARMRKEGFVTWAYSGAAGTWYPRGLVTSGQDLVLAVGANATDQNTLPALKAIAARYTSSQAALGFFGATPVIKPTGVTADATSIYNALVSLGLIGA